MIILIPSSARWWRRRWSCRRIWGGERCRQTWDSRDIWPRIWRPWRAWSLSALNPPDYEAEWSQADPFKRLIWPVLRSEVWRNNEWLVGWAQTASPFTAHLHHNSLSPQWQRQTTVNQLIVNEGTKDANNEIIFSVRSFRYYLMIQHTTNIRCHAVLECQD